jgi:16S rRNA (uracil1498-N3)-methyltransferase
VVEKATELGVARISPVITQFTVADRINEAKFSAIAIEAAEQCERLDLPIISPLAPLEKQLEHWPEERLLIYGDESGAAANAKEVLPHLMQGSYALLIGPEGGFSQGELALLRSLPYVKGMCLGPRVLRADTATVAALALLQAFCGDWEGKPAFRN